MTVEINFAVDFTDPTRYTLISGSPLSIFGNPSPALYGKPAKIELRLPLPGTVTFVAADFTRNQASSLNARCDILLKRTTGSNMSFTSVTNCPGLQSCPFLSFIRTVTVTDVIMISYEAYSPNAFGRKFEAWLDNCAARVTFDTSAIISTIQGKVGATFTGACISGQRLYALVSALQGYDATQVDAMLGLIGMYPELEAPLRQRKLNESFTAMKTALQTNPAIYPQTELNAYKTAIQDAFGVTLSEEPNADVWGAPDRGIAALHFARLGLEAVANAFENWVVSQIGLYQKCYTVNKFALFQRILGQLTLLNASQERDTIAETSGKTIKIFRKTGAGYQWVMTPNNLIHEIGHSFSRAAGADTVKLGSIEEALEDTTLIAGYNRDGMGSDYLKPIQGNYDSLFFVHSLVSDNGSGNAIFTKQGTYPDAAVEDFLFGDLFATNFALWNSNYNLYRFGEPNIQARIDIFVQNWPPDGDSSDIKLREIAADAFLNWVRASFEGTTEAQWQAFFDQNIGKFMRNSTIYRNGMSNHYIANNLVRATQTASRDFIQIPNEEGELGWPNLRFIPTTDNDGLIGSAPISQRDPLSSKIYGWWEEASTGTKWLFVDTSQTDGQRLGWVIASGMQSETSDLVDNPPPTGNRILDYAPINPGRVFGESDLCTLLGLLTSECT